jgi:hypothetical protein
LQTTREKISVLEQVADGTLVWYHGSEEYDHGFGTVRPYTYGHGKYVFIPLDDDTVNLYNVSRSSFTVVPEPELPEPTLEPGFYQTIGDTPKKDYYVLTPDYRWIWVAFDEHDHGQATPEYLDEPACELHYLEEWMD